MCTGRFPLFVGNPPGREVRSVPVNNPHRYPVVFTVRITQSVVQPHCPPRTGEPLTLRDPVIVTLTPGVMLGKFHCVCVSPLLYFRHEVPVVMLFAAYGYTDLDIVCKMIAQTTVFDATTVRSLLYVTLQTEIASPFLFFLNRCLLSLSAAHCCSAYTGRGNCYSEQLHAIWAHHRIASSSSSTVIHNQDGTTWKGCAVPVVGSGGPVACKCASTPFKPSREDGLFGTHGWHFAQSHIRPHCTRQSTV